MLIILTVYNEKHLGQRSRAFIIFLEPLMKHFNSFLSATTRCCGGVEYNPVFISVSSRVASLKRWTSLYHWVMGQIFQLNGYF